MTHELEGGTAINDANGVKAKCTCGWQSTGYYFHGWALAAFRRHQAENAPPENPDDGGWDSRYEGIHTNGPPRHDR